MHRIAPLTELWALITACPVGVRHSALPSGCILRPSETRCSLHVSDWLIVLMKLFYLRPSLQAPLPYSVAFLPTALAAWTLSQQVIWNRIYRQIQLWCNMIYIRGFKHAARDALWNFQITVLTIKLSRQQASKGDAAESARKVFHQEIDFTLFNLLQSCKL